MKNNLKDHPVEKAIFFIEQPTVKIQTFDGIDYIYICLNGMKKNDENGDEIIEYDYKEIQVPSGTIDINHLRLHPECYLDWKKQAEPTLNDVIDAINALTQLILGGEKSQ